MLEGIAIYTTHNFLDGYIDRPKLTEQKKVEPVEHIVPPPLNEVGTFMSYNFISIVNR